LDATFAAWLVDRNEMWFACYPCHEAVQSLLSIHTSKAHAVSDNPAAIARLDFTHDSIDALAILHPWQTPKKIILLSVMQRAKYRNSPRLQYSIAAHISISEEIVKSRPCVLLDVSFPFGHLHNATSIRWVGKHISA
jgi:hypothetical protein